jgi:hypothetical protein
MRMRSREIVFESLAEVYEIAEVSEMSNLMAEG